ncbi:uncharacterized protein PITG_10047 [Phytophthora infestans T30-4]|uniref:Uncharacterized protein n=1 Tax=Phytophthora infestans (strain T30-4) TaxID=403677 RepID=D0NE64_PHYIT|nr:uncharacterized protein PITG_10047 [Phytophthora infestans T30-4]EEY56509.1 conserved hypothetical protein [Phytophthora infestans T30-4]|eukprot:XP_002902583.1 conserved hypothetical protein [Phytophthora infestans T30-4]
MGDISALGIRSLFFVIGPLFSGKNNLCLFILKNFPYVFAHLTNIARNPHQELVNQVRRTPLSSNKPELVFIDNYINDKLLQKKVSSHSMTRGRYFKLSSIFLSHSYFAIDKMLRLKTIDCSLLQSRD